MKKIIFFDIDNTIVDSKTEEVPNQTLRLLEELSKNDNYYLAIATGRGPGRLDIIKDIIHFFDAFVFSNGAYVTLHGEVIYDHPFNSNEVKKILKVADKYDLLAGVSGVSTDAILRKPINEVINLRNTAILTPTFYKDHLVYQMWLATANRPKLKQAVNELPDFDHYFWTTIGVDFTINKHSKASGILKIKEKLDPIKVISIGDGHNDIDMIEVADIGIAMGNTRFSELKEKADLIGPNVSDDKLYDFLKEHQVI